MKRLTRPKDNYECRINGCQIEDWLLKLGVDAISEYVCDDCYLMPFINKLAEYEDAAELAEDDGK